MPVGNSGATGSGVGATRPGLAGLTGKTVLFCPDII